MPASRPVGPAHRTRVAGAAVLVLVLVIAVWPRPARGSAKGAATVAAASRRKATTVRVKRSVPRRTVPATTVARGRGGARAASSATTIAPATTAPVPVSTTAPTTAATAATAAPSTAAAAPAPAPATVARIAPTTARPSLVFTASPAVAVVRAGAAVDVSLSAQRTALVDPVRLSVSGLPSGAASELSVNPIVDTSRLTLTVALSVAAGDYPLVVSAASGELVQTANVTLRVQPAERIQLAVSTPPLLIAGGTTSFSVTATVADPLDATPVQLAFGAIASGLTFTSTGTPSSGAVLVAVVASPTMPPGSYPLLIDAVKGATRAQAVAWIQVAAAGTVPPNTIVSLTLTAVADPSGAAKGFALVASLPTVTVARGSSGATAVSVVTSGGYTDTLSLSAAPPAGLAVTFSAAGTNTFLTTVTADVGMPAGTYSVPVTVSGSAGTMTIRLTATVP